MDIEKARVEARTILDKFGSELKNIKLSSKELVNTSEKGVRHEKKIEPSDSNFKTIMFKNAPKSDGECLILEKATW